MVQGPVRLLAFFTFLLSLPTAFAQRPFVVLHTAVTEATEDRDLEVTANVPRYREIRDLVLHYRKKGTATYRSLPLKRTQGDFYEGKLPAGEIRAPGVEYYLEIIDRDGGSHVVFAAVEGPQLVKVLPAGPTARPSRTDLEEELAVFSEEQVFSAARQRQRIEESPSAITVITAEDIRNYGATSVAEVLRTVPGIDYMQISGADPNLAARGFNREQSNRLLTLIDGRSAYIDLFGMTFWEALHISVWDIDRIEVIRGPGSTLYGANAYGGVVNIFTKTPEQSKGMHFYLQGGDHGFTSTLMAGGKAGKATSYRISVTHDQASSFDKVTVDDKLGVRGNALVQFELPDGAKLVLRGGLLREFVGPIMSLNGPLGIEATLGYAQLNFDYKDLRFQAWYTGAKADLTRSFPLPKSLRIPGLGDVPFRNLFGDFALKDIPGARPDTLDLETTYTLEPIRLLRMTFGANYRLNQYNIPSFLEPENREHLFGLFGQFEIRPHPTLNINVGARYDLLSFANDVCPRGRITECLAGSVGKVAVDSFHNFSPRGALVWGFHPEHFLRVSGGLAFRNPAFVENLLRYEVAGAGVIPGNPPRTRPPIIFSGNEKLQPEQLREVELGYGTNLFGKRLRVNLDLFYLEGIDLIAFLPGSLLGALSGVAPLNSTYANLINARNYGFELSLRATFTSWLKAFLNYSYQKVELKDKQALLGRIAQGEFPGVSRLQDLTTVDSESPMHKLNFGINLTHAPTGLFFNLYGHFAGGTFRRNNFTTIPSTAVASLGGATLGQLTGAQAQEQLGAYFLLNANLGYRLFQGQLEVGVAGLNILGAYDTLNGSGFDPVTGELQNRRHLEYPRLALQGQIVGGEAIGARVYGFIRGHFR
jgi:iron complex outermembrane receptor protein